jgi:hypothetical protein
MFRAAPLIDLAYHAALRRSASREPKAQATISTMNKSTWTK